MDIQQETNPWTDVSSEIKYDNPWIQVTHHQVITPTGTNGIYGKVHFKNIAIGIIPVDEEGNTWLVGQYRFVLDEYSWEIPEGGGLIGKNPLESAKKELAEEVGLAAEHWEQIACFNTSNSVTDEISYIYLATGLSKAFAEQDDTEVLKVKKIPLEAAFEMAYEGKFRDSLTLIGLMKLKWIMDKKEILWKKEAGK
jgi:8-oxo-dGTP pyrophosphatase MutT (NUDIX family)